jgi:hypothetical protein
VWRIGPPNRKRFGKHSVLRASTNECIDVRRVRVGFLGSYKPSSDSDCGSAGGECRGHRVRRTNATGGYDRDLYGLKYLPQHRENPNTPTQVPSRFDALRRDHIAAGPFGGDGLGD